MRVPPQQQFGGAAAEMNPSSKIWVKQARMEFNIAGDTEVDTCCCYIYIISFFTYWFPPREGTYGGHLKM